MGACTSAEQTDLSPYFVHTPFAHSLTPEQLKTFSRYFVIRKFRKGADIFVGFSIVIEGEVHLMMNNQFFCPKKLGEYCGVVSFPQPEIASTHSGSTTPSPAKRKRTDAKRAIRGTKESALAYTDCILLEISNLNVDRLYDEQSDIAALVFPLMGQGAVECLSRMSLFKEAGAQKLVLLESLIKYKPLHAKEVLFEEGSIGDSMFIVSKGRLRAVHKNPTTGQLLVMREFSEGGMFGEISLVMDIPRTASIIALEDCVLFELNRDNYQILLRMLPHVGLEDVVKMRTAEQFRKYKVPFFEAIPEDKYASLATVCQIHVIPEKTVLFREGDPGATFYIIADGEMSATLNKDGKEITLSVMGPGKYFGEIALVQETNRTATVTAMTRCVILAITKVNFEKFFREAPEAIADFEIKLARYNVQLRSVLYHPVGLRYFIRHLRREYSEENIAFWMACRDFRHLSPADLPTQTLSKPEKDEILWTGKAVSAEDLHECFALFSPSQTHISFQDLIRTIQLLDIGADENDVRDMADFMGMSPDSQLVTHDNFIKSLATPPRASFSVPAANRGEIGGPSDVRHHKFAGTRLIVQLRRAMQFVQLGKLKQTFQKVDFHGTNTLPFSSVQEALHQLGDEEWTDKEVRKEFDRLADSNGEMDFLTFVSFYITRKKKLTKFKTMLWQRAQTIYDAYISAGSQHQVNIDGPTRERIAQDLATRNVSSRIFDSAEALVLKLLEGDSFPRFKQSEMFQNFLDGAQTYKDYEERGFPLEDDDVFSRSKKGSMSNRHASKPSSRKNSRSKGDDEPARKSSGANDRALETALGVATAAMEGAHDVIEGGPHDGTQNGDDDRQTRLERGGSSKRSRSRTEHKSRSRTQHSDNRDD